MCLLQFRIVIYCLLCASIGARAEPSNAFAMAQVLDYPFAAELAAAGQADVIAWTRNIAGIRNAWMAHGPDFAPHQLTHFADDDGQELTHLTFSPDGRHLVLVRGGDHDANWPAEGNLAPNPAASSAQPSVSIWGVSLQGEAPLKIADGDSPAISTRGRMVFVKDDQVWTAGLDGTAKPERLFFDRGKDSDLQWSPDGSRLAFVSNRGSHAFIGIFTLEDQRTTFLAPTTDTDLSPRWSTDGTRVAFVRQSSKGGPPEPLLGQTPQPWSIWVADASDGSGRRVWQSPRTLAGSYPDVEGEANLHWAAGDRLVFLAYLDDWQHLYSVAAAGGEPLLLTPGAFMVEHVAQSRDRRFMVYDANAGLTPGDGERRHVFRVPVDRAAPAALTTGRTLEWSPVAASADRIAFITAGVQEPPAVGLVSLDATRRSVLPADRLPDDFPLKKLIAPAPVTFQAADGTTVHGQLFQQAAHGAPSRPAIIFLHGGPPRQMLLGWHYMDYYSNAYAVNQYLTAHGFVVLSVNYRLGIGYGRAFNHPEHAGPRGAAEYQDVVAGVQFLQALPGVDPKRIGMWGGSYGGYLTALALARNSDLVAAGVDLHGVHDWSRIADDLFGKAETRYEKGDREEAMRIAWTSSPVAAIDGWRSPVLLIQGDDDRNVPFQQTVDLARRLEDANRPVEELVIPNEIHGFLRHASWLHADQATADFFERRLRP